MELVFATAKHFPLRVLRHSLRGFSLAAIAATLTSTPFAHTQERAQEQAQAGYSVPSTRTQASIYSHAFILNSRDFLPEALMSSPVHRVDSRVQNDGFANHYIIRTPHGTHIVTGTEQAKVRIFEIKVTEALRKKSTISAVGKMAERKTLNLVKTPVRAVSVIGNRLDTVHSVEDAVFFIPQNVGLLLGHVGNGVGELFVTGRRLVTPGDGGGLKCVGLACISEISKDALSGVNSFVGKHSAARRIHREMGTNSQSRNKALQDQVDRLAYVEAYSGTLLSLSIGNIYTKIDYTTPLARGVGHVNNGEFVVGYKDAHRVRNRDKARLISCGVAKNDVKAFYKNKTYTKSMRAEMAELLESFATPRARANLIAIAKDANAPYTAHQNLVTLRYLKKAIVQGQLQGLAAEPVGAVGVKPDGTLVLPYVADYLQLTPRSEKIINFLSDLKQRNHRYSGAEIHIIGKASPQFISAAGANGIRVTLGT